MNPRDYTASCAICGGPGDPECPCEGKRLEIAIEQAEKRWIEGWISKTREWVTNQSVAYITQTFERLKSIRIANHTAYLRQLPYWPLWEQYRGRPPLHPHIIAQLQRQIQDADADLRRGIDADWKACVIRYPEVLAHFYSAVNVVIPQKSSDVTMPNLGGLTSALGGIPPPALITNTITTATAPAHPGLHRSQTAPPKEHKQRDRANSHVNAASIAENIHAAAVREKLQALMSGQMQHGAPLTTAATNIAQPIPQRPQKPKRTSSHATHNPSHRASAALRQSLEVDREWLAGLDDDIRDLALKKTAMNGSAGAGLSAKASKKGRNTPAPPPSSVAGDPATGTRRKRRESKDMGGGALGSKTTLPAVPQAPNFWDRFGGGGIGVLPETGVRNYPGAI